MASAKVEFIEGEKQYLKFTVTYEESGSAVDVSSATCTLKLYNAGGTFLEKEDTDFVKTDGEDGILTVLCSLSAEGRYTGVLTLSFSSGNLVKVCKFGLRIRGVD